MALIFAIDFIYFLQPDLLNYWIFDVSSAILYYKYKAINACKFCGIIYINTSIWILRNALSC